MFLKERGVWYVSGEWEAAWRAGGSSEMAKERARARVKAMAKGVTGGAGLARGGWPFEPEPLKRRFGMKDTKGFRLGARLLAKAEEGSSV
ncbi:hypothetical protein FOPE_03513 [Fonsecaea pedrosoi]|nr:hypothetical protein FOPE_03513 [Fonsecaea pedrosoi]